MDCPDEQGVCSGNPPAIVADGWVVGTGMHAREVAEACERHGSIAAAARATGLSAHQVRVALEWAERSELAHPSAS